MKNFDLIWAREYAGITQTKLAEIFGVSRRTVINWEQGHTKLPSAKFKYLLSVLDIAPELVPKNTNPEPVSVPAASPAPREPAPVSDPSRPHRRTWKDRPGKDFKNDVLGIAVELSNLQASFDVPDAFGRWLRAWGRDGTPIDIAWQFMYSMLRLLEDPHDLLVRVNPEEKDRDDWQWALTQKGWEAFEKRYMENYYHEGAPTPSEMYPNAYARLFESLV